jgi:hypothetical protein
MTRSFTALTLALICFASNANAIECQSDKGSGSPWSWRLIDGKQCWYKGQRGMDKKLLRWPEAVGASEASAEQAPAVANKDESERERLLHSYWPPLR